MNSVKTLNSNIKTYRILWEKEELVDMRGYIKSI